RWPRDWSSDVCSSDLGLLLGRFGTADLYFRRGLQTAARRIGSLFSDSSTRKPAGGLGLEAKRSHQRPAGARREMEKVGTAISRRSEERRVGKECRYQR